MQVAGSTSPLQILCACRNCPCAASTCFPSVELHLSGAGDILPSHLEVLGELGQEAGICLSFEYSVLASSAKILRLEWKASGGDTAGRSLAAHCLCGLYMLALLTILGFLFVANLILLSFKCCQNSRNPWILRCYFAMYADKATA